MSVSIIKVDFENSFEKNHVMQSKKRRTFNGSYAPWKPCENSVFNLKIMTFKFARFNIFVICVNGLLSAYLLFLDELPVRMYPFHSYGW